MVRGLIAGLRHVDTLAFDDADELHRLLGASLQAGGELESLHKRQRRASSVDEASSTTSSPSSAASADAARSDSKADEPLACCVCFEQYSAQPAAEGELDHMPRALPCGHDLCTDCLSKIVRDQLVKCPECREQRRIPLPAGIAAASLSSAVDWARLLPLNRSLISIVQKRCQQVSNGAKPALQQCQFMQCTEAATSYCCDCSGVTDFCSAHDRFVHLQSCGHTRVPLSNKAAAVDRKFRQFIAPLAAAKRQELREALMQKEQQGAAAEEALHEASAHLSAAKKRAAEASIVDKACKGAIASMRDQLARAEQSDDADLVRQLAQADTLHLRMPEGLLKELTCEQQRHFIRLLPDVKPVSQRSPACSDRAMTAGFSRSSLLRLWLRCPGQAAPTLPRQ